jgi:cytochrome c oxidase cbb3-type subunit 1
MHPYYIARAVGGLLFLIGACVGAYNIWLTVTRPLAAAEAADDQPVPADVGVAPQPAE